MMDWIKEHSAVIGVCVALAGLILTALAISFRWIPIWYEDADGDGFGNSATSSWLVRPDGYVANRQDCYDANELAKPGEMSFFKTERGDGSFDYDCDGRAEREEVRIGSCSNGTANQGWEKSTPACGEAGQWLYDCDRKVQVFPPKITTIRETRPRTQGCQ